LILLDRVNGLLTPRGSDSRRGGESDGWEVG